jgi:hypothetical protein
MRENMDAYKFRGAEFEMAIDLSPDPHKQSLKRGGFFLVNSRLDVAFREVTDVACQTPRRTIVGRWIPGARC